MFDIDITMTATIRPEILNQTLSSFSRNMFKNEIKRYRLIINIDRVGEDKKPKEVLKVCKKYFDENQIIYNVPDVPSFTNAVIWTWKQTTAPYVFHLEDDWLLTRSIDVNQIINILNKIPVLACLRFCKHRIPKGTNVRLFACKYIYSNDYKILIARDSRKQFGLNPVIIKRQFVDETKNLLNPELNPEKQFRYSNPKVRDIIMKWKYGIYGVPGEAPLVLDNGRVWRRKNKIDKPKDKSFTKWVRVKG